MWSILVYLLLFGSFSIANDRWIGYVSFWSPKTTVPNKDFQVFFKPTLLDSKTDIAIQVAKSNATISLVDDKLDHIKFHPKIPSQKNELKLAVTLFQNTSSGDGKCITNSYTIKVDKRNFFIFVQTDKPIYKPGDEVKFRVLVLDKNLRPIQINNIDISIIDPNGEIIQIYDDLGDGKNEGIIVETFQLDRITPLGNWIIKVIVDRRNLSYFKEFSVHEYKLPHYNFNIRIPTNKILYDDSFDISIEAKYPYGEFVIGDIRLKIRDLTNAKDLMDKTYTNRVGFYTCLYKPASLYITPDQNVELEAFVEFTETSSGVAFNKTAKVWVFGDPRDHITVDHPSSFIPGQPFNILVRFYDWKFDPHHKKDDLSIKYKYFSNSEIFVETYIVGVIENYLTHTIMAPKDSQKLELEVQYISSTPYRNTIHQGKIDTSINVLIVSCSPNKIPSTGNVILTVTSPKPMHDIVIDIATSFSSHKILQHDCANERVCSVQINIFQDMRPYSKIIVYYVQDKHHVFKGQTEIRSESLTFNHLNFKLSKTIAKVKDDIKIKFEGLKESKIYLLAIDDRLLGVKDGHDITREDVEKRVEDFESENFYFIQELKSWHKCTTEELVRVNTKRILNTDQSGGEAILEYDNSVATEEDTDELMVIENRQKGMCDSLECIRRDKFPETWIFTELDMSDCDETAKHFKLPDSITTWHISAFSIHKLHGIAIANPRKLIVKNDFFMETIMPYAIRHKEGLRIDILIYNFVDTKKSVDADIFMVKKEENGYDFIEYKSNNCTVTKIDSKYIKHSIKINYGKFEKVSFYIQSNEFMDKDMLDLSFMARGKSENVINYKDVMNKKLKVNPIGVSDISINSFSGENSSSGNLGTPQISQSSTTIKSINVVVSGEYLFDDLKDLSFETNLNENVFLEAVLNLKLNIEKYRYNKSNVTMVSIYKQEVYKMFHKINNSCSSLLINIFLADSLATIGKYELKESYKNRTLNHLFECIGNNIKNIAEKKQITEHYGQFSNLGSIGQMSLAVIPLLKHRIIFSNEFDLYIDQAFKYMKENPDIYSPYDYSISSYAYILKEQNYGNNGLKYANTENNITIDQENIKFEHNNLRCFKLKKSDKKCDVIQTLYITLSSIKRKNIAEVTPSIRWLYNQFQEGLKYQSKLLERTLISEIFGELGEKIKSRETSLQIQVSNNMPKKQQKETIRINIANIRTPFNIKMSEYSRKISYKIDGIGFWSVTVIYELLKLSPQPSQIFDVTVAASDGQYTSNEIKICGSYKSDHHVVKNDKSPLVIYEVEIPSGYIYEKIKNLNETTILKNVAEIDIRRGKTLVFIKFLEFYVDDQNCIIIEVKKIFEVTKQQLSSVKVYNYNLREKMAVEFYKFSNSCMA